MSMRILFLILLAVAGFIGCSDDGGGSAPVIMGTVEPNVGGSEQPNQVFVDLSTKTQVAIPRRNWDLGFTTDGNFRVVLNGANGMLAIPSNTINFDEITSAHLDSFPYSVQDLGALFGILVTPGMKPPWFPQAASWADHPDGSIDKTAFKEINAVHDQNPVYIVNRGKNPNGNPRGFMKVKVDRNGNGYTLYYGNMDDAVPQSIDVVKDNDYNFIFADLNTGIVEVEPKKTEWDIAFSTYTDHVLSEQTSGYPVPYVVQDFIYLNRFGTFEQT